MSVETFGLPREATIQLNDVFGPLPLVSDVRSVTTVPGGAPQIESAVTVPPPEDFDAAITAQVRNTGRFKDGEYGISDGPFLADYGIVLVDDLRTQQQEEATAILQELGVETIDDLTQEKYAQVHPDSRSRLESLSNALVLVANNAPRTSEHNETGRNGNDFYVATTESGLEVYAQAHLLSSLDARGRITSLRRIPEGVAWQEGEQFRSSVVSDARRHPADLIKIERDENWPIPALDDGVKMAYVDKFANVRLQTSDVSKHGEVLREAEKVDLVLDDGRVCIGGIRVVSRMTDIAEDEFGAYFNVADRDVTQGPAYLELVRRVSNCNGDTQPRAYHELAQRVGVLLGREVKLSDWSNIIFDLVPHQPEATHAAETLTPAA